MDINKINAMFKEMLDDVKYIKLKSFIQTQKQNNR